MQNIYKANMQVFGTFFLAYVLKTYGLSDTDKDNNGLQYVALDILLTLVNFCLIVTVAVTGFHEYKEEQRALSKVTPLHNDDQGGQGGTSGGGDCSEDKKKKKKKRKEQEHEKEKEQEKITTMSLVAKKKKEEEEQQLVLEDMEEEDDEEEEEEEEVELEEEYE